MAAQPAQLPKLPRPLLATDPNGTSAVQDEASQNPKTIPVICDKIVIATFRYQREVRLCNIFWHEITSIFQDPQHSLAGQAASIVAAPAAPDVYPTFFEPLR